MIEASHPFHITTADIEGDAVGASLAQLTLGPTSPSSMTMKTLKRCHTRNDKGWARTGGREEYDAIIVFKLYGDILAGIFHSFREAKKEHLTCMILFST